MKCVNLPDWNVIPHKGMKVPPKEELLKQIKVLAEKEVIATTGEEKEYISKEHKKLRAQYISVVSPDRKSLYKQAVDKINKLGNKKQSVKCFEGEKTLFDYLNEHDGIGKQGIINSKSYHLDSGGTVTPIYDSKGGYVFEINNGAEKVMSIDTTLGITFSLTNTEHNLFDEFNLIYSIAKNNVMSSNNFETDNNSFNIKV